jgi:hypothetical protein
MGGSLPAELLTSDRHFERVAGLACTICKDDGDPLGR